MKIFTFLFCFTLFVTSIFGQEENDYFEFIGSIGSGICRELSVEENYLFLVVGNAMNIFDLQQESKELISTIDCSIEILDYSVKKNLIAISVSGNKILLYDLSNPVNPKFIDQIGGYSNFVKVEIIDSKLITLSMHFYVPYEEPFGMRIFDISNLENIEEIGFSRIWDGGSSFSLSSTFGYSADGTITYYDFSDPTDINVKWYSGLEADLIITQNNFVYTAYENQLIIYERRNEIELHKIFETDYDKNIEEMFIENNMLVLKSYDQDQTNIMSYDIRGNQTPEFLTDLIIDEKIKHLVLSNLKIYYTSVNGCYFLSLDEADQNNIVEIFSPIQLGESFSIKNDNLYFALNSTNIGKYEIPMYGVPVLANIVKGENKILQILTADDYIYVLTDKEINIYDDASGNSPSLISRIELVFEYDRINLTYHQKKLFVSYDNLNYDEAKIIIYNIDDILNPFKQGELISEDVNYCANIKFYNNQLITEHFSRLSFYDINNISAIHHNYDISITGIENAIYDYLIIEDQLIISEYNKMSSYKLNNQGIFEHDKLLFDEYHSFHKFDLYGNKALTKNYDGFFVLDCDDIDQIKVDGPINLTGQNSHFSYKYLGEQLYIKINGGDLLVYNNKSVIDIDPDQSFAELFHNYPNPFNSSTTVKYFIPEAAISSDEMLHIKLEIFNALGQKIKTLVNQPQQAGTYEVEFYANNLPSGVYYYRLQAGQYSETKKMLLLQ